MFRKPWRAILAILTMVGLALVPSAAYAYEDYDRQVNAERDAQCEFWLTENNLLRWKVVGDVIAVQLDQLGNVPFEGQRSNPYEGPRVITLFAIESLDPVEFFTCKVFVPVWQSEGTGSLSTPGGPGGPNPPNVCPEGQVGSPPNCEVTPPEECPPGYTGYVPNCEPITGECPDGRGEWPNCEEPPTECPEGYTGTPPNCEAIPPEECPEGYSGTWPNCVEPPPAECPEGTTGTPPNCEEPPPEECPEGQVGSPPNCNDPGPPDEHCDNGVGTGPDCQPPGDPPPNDDCEGAAPGTPGCSEEDEEEEEEEEEPEACTNGGVGANCTVPGRP